MPALVSNYRKHVVETRLKKFYSTFKQAVDYKVATDGSIDYSMLSDANNPNTVLEFFDANYGQYIQTTEIMKRTRDIIVRFPDGSGMYLRKDYVASNCIQSSCNLYPLFCVDYKTCKNLSENSSPTTFIDGKGVFMINPYGSLWGWDHTLENLKTECGGTQKSSCMALIMHHNWTIPDDYPIKF